MVTFVFSYFQSSKQSSKVNADLRETPKSCTFIEQADHSPKLNDVPKLWSSLKKSDQLASARTLMKQPRERVSASESNLVIILTARNNLDCEYFCQYL